MRIDGTGNVSMLRRLGVGAAITSGDMARITNTTAADKVLVVKGAASQSGDFIDVQNSSGFSVFKVNNTGAGWFRQVANGLQTNIQLGRMDDSQGSPLYRIQTDDTNGDILRFYSLRWGSTVKFARGSSSGDKDIVRITGGDSNTIDVFDASNSLNTRINSNGATFFNGGNVGIGTSSPATKLHVVGTITGYGNVSGTDQTDAARLGTNTTATSVGVLRVGNATATTTCITTNGVSATIYHMAFHSSGSNVGGISSSGSTTSFNTSSDYRLKENVVTLNNALSTIEMLQPKAYNFITTPDVVQHGFIAHELQEVLPYAVTGEKDALDNEGNIRPQQVDYSKLTGLLVGAVQELSAQVQELSARVRELENNQ
jgi:hypothetical protein